MSTEPPSHKPPYPGPTADSDPRPWWYREDRERQEQINKRQEAAIDRLGDRITKGFDKVADELATTRGAQTGKKATWAGIGTFLLVAAAVGGVLTAILVPLLS